MIGLGETWLDYITTGGAEYAYACYVDIAANKAKRMTEPLHMLTLSRHAEMALVHEIAEWRKERGDAEGYGLAMDRLRDILAA